MGSDSSLSDVGEVADILAVALGEYNWAVLEWGVDVNASSGGLDPTA